MTNPVVNYDGDGSTTDFSVPFSYLRESDVLVYVSSVLQTKGTDYSFLNASTIRFTSAPATGTSNVQFARETDIDNPIVNFEDSSDFTEDNINRADSQSRYKLQEIEYTVDNLPTGAATGDVPAPTGANQFLVSDGTPEWTRQDVSGVLTTLGITGAVPSPDPGNKVIFTDASTSTYVLKTLSEAKTLLGIDSNVLPDPNNINQGFITTNAAGDGFQILTQTQTKSLLGFGTAADYNTGTTVGTIPLLGTGGSLPAVSGENLTNIVRDVAESAITLKADLVLSTDYSNGEPMAIFVQCHDVGGTTVEVYVSPDSDAANYILAGKLGLQNAGTNLGFFVPSGGMYKFEFSLPDQVMVQKFS